MEQSITLQQWEDLNLLVFSLVTGKKNIEPDPKLGAINASDFCNAIDVGKACGDLLKVLNLKIKSVD